MYGIAYVIIPTEFESLQAALDEALAPFRRGGPDEFPREALAFDDVTDELRQLHRLPITLEAKGAGVVLQSNDSASADDFDFAALAEFLAATGAPSWSGRFADVEPDLDAFARRFTRWKERDARAGGYGRWLNPLGRWDWWELGGRFDGLVSGQRRAGAGADSMISSGPNRGRDLIGGVARAFGGKPSEVEAEIAANVDLASALLEAARRGEEHAFPTAIVLPVGACAPEFRWFDALGWRPIASETKTLLSVPAEATFEESATEAYGRWADMAVAGVAYHF
jgi:hypothetical protein